MVVYKNERLSELVINESVILGFRWANDAKDVEMDIDWCGQENLKNEFDFLKIKTKLFFQFVTDLEISIDFGRYNMGTMEITTFSFTLNDNVWDVMFTFNYIPKGFIKLKCNTLSFLIEQY
jgi:hypothetical protein